MAKAKKTHKKTIRLWSAGDLKQLRQMARQKILARVAAKKLKRTLAAVYIKASQESIRFSK